jgi:16S rRNA (adenine1518-N6/adenine1519-N6)-dimethyltransferase
MSALSSYIRDMCRAADIRLNTDLGQHFLVDEGVLADIIAAGKIVPGERVVEIGAGMGMLTKELLAAGAQVTAIELDKRWPPFLYAYVGSLGDGGRLTLIQGNALDVPFPDEPYAVIANIPYHITSPLLRHAFLESPRAPSRMVLLIQREVAERICDDEDGNLLSLTVGLFGTPRIVRNVGASSFLPPPQVESAVLAIDCFAEPRVDSATLDRVLKLAKMAFAQKRKMLSNSLGNTEEGAAMLVAAGIDKTRRPQTLSIDEWITLAKTAA